MTIKDKQFGEIVEAVKWIKLGITRIEKSIDDHKQEIKENYATKLDLKILDQKYKPIKMAIVAVGSIILGVIVTEFMKVIIK